MYRVSFWPFWPLALRFILLKTIEVSLNNHDNNINGLLKRGIESAWKSSAKLKPGGQSLMDLLCFGVMFVSWKLESIKRVLFTWSWLLLPKKTHFEWTSNAPTKRYWCLHMRDEHYIVHLNQIHAPIFIKWYTTKWIKESLIKSYFKSRLWNELREKSPFKVISCFMVDGFFVSLAIYIEKPIVPCLTFLGKLAVAFNVITLIPVVFELACQHYQSFDWDICPGGKWDWHKFYHHIFELQT